MFLKLIYNWNIVVFVKFTIWAQEQFLLSAFLSLFVWNLSCFFACIPIFPTHIFQLIYRKNHSFLFLWTSSYSQQIPEYYFAARSKYNTTILQASGSSLCSSFLAFVGMEALLDKRLNIIVPIAFYHSTPGLMLPCYERGWVAAKPQTLNHPH